MEGQHYQVAIRRGAVWSVKFGRCSYACQTTRYFADKLPVGVDPHGRSHTFLYLVTKSSPIDFRAFLERHGELLRALPAWTIRLLVPQHLKRAVMSYHAAFREQLTMPLRPVVLDDLRW